MKMAQDVPLLPVTANGARCVPAKSAQTRSLEWPRRSPWTSAGAALPSGSGYPEEEAWFFARGGGAVKSWSLWGPVCGLQVAISPAGGGAGKGEERKRFQSDWLALGHLRACILLVHLLLTESKPK